MLKGGVPSTERNEFANLINAEVKNFEGNQSLKNIVKLLWSLHDQDSPKWGELYSQKNRQRITQRFYEFAKELTQKWNFYLKIGDSTNY